MRAMLPERQTSLPAAAAPAKTLLWIQIQCDGNWRPLSFSMYPGVEEKVRAEPAPPLARAS